MVFKSDQRQVYSMFDRIASRYDFLNHFLSGGTDIIWRRKLVRMAKSDPNLEVLDVATGTADLAIAFVKKRNNIKNVIGLDMAKEMLAIGDEKLKDMGLTDKVQLKQGDASKLKYKSESFDVLSISFGIRNVAEYERALKEFHRVLKHQGECFILEFSLPSNKIVRVLYLFYFRYILPILAGIVSGSLSAYRYLNKTVESFPHGDAFAEKLTAAGFKDVQQHKLTFGIETIYHAKK